MPNMFEVSTIAQVVQFAVAPVLLLTGIGAFLAVMTSRLARIIDRAREIEAQADAALPKDRIALYVELDTLSKRAKLIGPAITLCTVTALLVCLVIAVLFSSAFIPFDMTITVALLFVTAMLSFSVGLLWFIREIHLATVSLEIGFKRVHRRPGVVSTTRNARQRDVAV